MRIKIKKNVLGEEYIFYAHIKLGTDACTVELCARIGEYAATVSDDFTKIILDEPLPLTGYGRAIGSLAGYGEATTKEVKFLKLSKSNSRMAKEYVLDLI